MKNRHLIGSWSIACFSVILMVSLSLAASADEPPIPTGFTSDFRVLMSTGVVDNAEQPDPPFLNCFSALCDGDYFHKVVMGRSDAEIADLEQLAKTFYLERFGIDVDDPANAGRLHFQRYTLDPRMNYRNYIAAGKQVPAEGWHLYDGGWVVVVIDPNGYTLRGEWAGYHTRVNTLIYFGNYHIMETDASGEVVNEVDFFYRAGGPMNFDTGFDASFNCELSLDGQDFPTGVHGVGQGITSTVPVSSTAIRITVRTVLTFGPSSPTPGLGPEGISGPIPLIGGGFYGSDD
ncbi:hypothetical protein [Candidatus Entotheonella palauensis]|uniref:hypothetical protein n=1 Tax=Candidatus Entotheonella palauensis TaxID=93172 RepID=UPI000B800013|nr:hypothetical protein [Candidatus Entotheonella palauensis]